MKKLLLGILLPLHLLATPSPTASCPAGLSPTTTAIPLYSPAAKQEFYAIHIYQLKTSQQEARVDSFLQHALLPALHRQGIAEVGVFKAIGNDTAAIRLIYVFIPLKSLEQFAALPGSLAKDAQYLTDGKS